LQNLAQLSANGIDTTAATTASATAEQSISTASEALSKARDTFEKALASKAPKDYLPEIKTSIKSAAGTVREAHNALVNSIKELRKIIRLNNSNSS